ncbi:hypothetical protein NL676_006223 [Syzygium grande]|nr:hypothetical protein NL676_006223 [Syzygium grande]
MMKLRSKRFGRSSSKLSSNGGGGGKGSPSVERSCSGNMEIKWELRPGGMLVQKRDGSSGSESSGGGTVTVRVSTVAEWHDIPIESTSTFGELKTILALVTGLEPREQRLLFKGKEREDSEHLHMVGVKDKDKVLLLEDPAIKERKKLHGNHIASSQQIVNHPFRTISV